MKLIIPLALVSLLLSASTTLAGVTITGDVNPSDPEAWLTTGGRSVGGAGDGSLTVDGGSDIFGGCVIDGAFGSRGVVTISGTNSTWTIYPESNGQISGELYVGSGGIGELNILDGGSVNNRRTFIASMESTGTVTVSGTNSQWINSEELWVGCAGHGTLNIEDGGFVMNTVGALARTPGLYTRGLGRGIVNVSGPGSTWVNTAELYIGYDGRGSRINITDGGTVLSYGTSYIAYDGNHVYPNEFETLFVPSTGQVAVSGVGSRWTNYDDLHIGRKGEATLTIEEGGLVSVAGTLIIDNGGYGEDFDNSINMSTGGMLLLAGSAYDSLDSFLDLIYGTDTIQWWDDSVSGWAPLTTATYGEDYTLHNFGSDTLLTVGTVTIPEPSTIALLATLLLGLVWHLSFKK